MYEKCCKFAGICDSCQSPFRYQDHSGAWSGRAVELCVKQKQSWRPRCRCCCGLSLLCHLRTMLRCRHPERSHDWTRAAISDGPVVLARESIREALMAAKEHMLHVEGLPHFDGWSKIVDAIWGWERDIVHKGSGGLGCRGQPNCLCH